VADRIRWGIAGTGGIASSFAEDLKLLPDAELVAVGSRARDSADAFGGRFGIPHRHVGYEALAADPEIDAIYVAVPHTGHCEVTLAAIAERKAVLVEKPFTLNAAEAEQMITAARAAGTFLMEAMWVRFLPHFVHVRELLAEGRIGEVRAVISDRGETLSTDPLHRVNNPELGGGALLDLGIYPISFASMVNGGRLPVRVEAVARRTETGVDAQSSMVFEYPSGAHAAISTSLDAPQREPRLDLRHRGPHRDRPALGPGEPGRAAPERPPLVHDNVAARGQRPAAPGRRGRPVPARPGSSRARSSRSTRR
jgi:predicted dehydrogenase